MQYKLIYLSIYEGLIKKKSYLCTVNIILTKIIYL